MNDLNAEEVQAEEWFEQQRVKQQQAIEAFGEAASEIARWIRISDQLASALMETMMPSDGPRRADYDSCRPPCDCERHAALKVWGDARITLIDGPEEDAMSVQDAESVAVEVTEFDRAMIALRLELPDIVWRDVWRRWMELRRLIDGTGVSE